jgi:hypothetical protein
MVVVIPSSSFKGDGHLPFKGRMGSQEVVAGDEEGDEVDSAVLTVEPMRRSYVMLEGSIEPLDRLLE